MKRGCMLTRREDFLITELDALNLTKKLETKFVPGIEKSHYSNVNAILIGLIAEEITGKSLIDLYDKYIFKTLNLSNTETIKKYNCVIPYFNNRANRYKYASSALACGGLVSTVDDLMIFIKAFTKGQLFSISNIENIKFNNIQFFPLKYSAGVMSIYIPP